MRKWFVSSILALAALAASVSPAYAGNVQVTDLAVSPGGDSVVLAVADGSRHLVRFDPAGRLVESFGDNGAITVDGEVTDVAIDPQGNVIVIKRNREGIPWSGSGPPHTLIRFAPDGGRDQSFGFQGEATSPTLGSLVAQPDGKVLVAGDGSTCFRAYCMDTGATLTRFTESGGLDPDFGDGGTVHRPEAYSFHSPAIDPSGRISAIGGFKFFRLDGSGEPEPGFDGIPMDQADVTAFTADGEKVLLGGSTWFTQLVRVQRLNADGTPDDSFGAADGTASPALGDDFGVSDLTVLPDGRVLLTSGGGAAQARLTATGQLDGSFGTGGRISLQPVPGITSSASAFHRGDGTLMAAGDETDLVVARIDSDGNLDPGFGVDGRSRWSSPRTVAPLVRYCFGKTGAHRADGGFATDGTPRDDVLAGGAGRDRLRGFGGRDSICGKAGRDIITPGAGRDRVRGGAGADRVLARDGRRDLIDCGSGRDLAVVDRQDRAANCERIRLRR